MGTLYMVRHGQASLGAKDYDNLSPLGWRQSEQLGAYFKAQGVVFGAVWTGTLKRHNQTLRGIGSGMGVELAATHNAAWNEYDSEALLAALPVTPPSPKASPAAYRQYFQLLRDALRGWADGVLSPQGMPSYPSFRQGIADALANLQTQPQGDVLLVSSGGPIATAAGLVLGTTPDTAIGLNLRLRNTAVTQVAVRSKRLDLVSFNEIPHLAGLAAADWVTYA
jgi:broad specificity phosphatase PhoE